MRPMYGVTHNSDGTARIQEPKTVKVGIGLPKGKAIHVYIGPDGKWVVMVGKDASRFEKKTEAQKFYRDSKLNAPERKYPQRLPYFTFSRVSPDGSFEPEWDAMESHGPVPTEIDIVFVKPEPLDASYQMWTATEKKCEGDGIDAQRVLSMASTAQEKELAAQCARNGDKTFPIVNGCWTRGCPYAKAQGDKSAPCKPHGRLLFQLLNAPRLGSTAYFDTTGFRSISQLFSCIETFKSITGGGDSNVGSVEGIPLKMVLRPYKTAHNGQAATQYGVGLEFRAATARDLKRLLVEHAAGYRIAADEPLKQLNAAPIDIRPEDDDDVAPEVAAAMNAEFNGDPDGGEDFSEPEHTPIQMPRRKSDPKPEPADNQDPYDYDIPQAIDSLWDDPSVPNDPPPTPQEAPPIKSPAAPPALGNGARWNKFLESSRAKGIPDMIIQQEMGKLGFERAGEITDKGYLELEQFVKAYKSNKALFDK